MSGHLAEFSEPEEDTQKGRYLAFRVGSGVYGIEIRHVTEIVGMQPITGVPEMPCHIKGIVNLRGKVFPVIDMRSRFHIPPMEYTPRTCIIVVEIQGVTVGLIIDSIVEVVHLRPEDIAPPPSGLTGVENRYILGVGKAGGGMQLLLDCSALLHGQELQEIETLSKVS